MAKMTGGQAMVESLKAQGLSLISDESLRSHLRSVYEELYQGMQGTADTEKRTSVNVFRPYFLKHFRNMRFRLTATPIDYNFIVKDPEFRNLVNLRLELVERVDIAWCVRTIVGINKLVAAIETDISR